MIKILIGLLLVILATSYIVQQQHIIDYMASLSSESQSVIVEATEKPKAKKAQGSVEQLAYPPPPDEPLLPYPAPDNSPIRTPLPTPTKRPLPTPAPTQDPWEN